MPEKKSFSQKIMESWIWGPIGIVISIIIGTLVVLYVFRGVISNPGIAPGADVSSFAHTAKVMVDYFKIYHRFPAMDLSWYAGFELFHAPPMISVFLGTIYYFTHDIYLTTRIFHPVGIGLLFLGMFWLMKKEKYSTLNALMAGLILIFMPTILLSLFSYTKLASLIFWPFGLYFTNQILTTNNNKYIAYLAITIGLIVYSHPMMAIVFGVMMTFYSTIYAILDRKIVSRRFFFVILAVALGFLLGAKYIIPFVLESAGRLDVSTQTQQFIGGFWELFRNFGGFSLLVLPMASLYVVWRRREAKLTALYLSGLLAFFILLGYYFFSLGNFFPFNQTYYYVWSFYFVFTTAYLLGLLIEGNKIKNLTSYFIKIISAVIVVLLVVYVVNHPTSYLRYFTINDNPVTYNADIRLVQAIDKIPNPGRVYITHYPFGFINWFLWLGTDRPNIEGHYYGIAEINKQIAHIGDAIHNNYPDYAINKLKHLNNRFLVTNYILARLKVSTGEPVGQEFINKLPTYGYKFIDQFVYTDGSTNKLWYLDRPSSYIMPVDEKVLIIGKYSSTLASAISGKITAIEGGSEYLDDYDQEFLKHFDTVVLYGFSYHNKHKAESIARNYTANGGNVVVEMFNMGISPLAENPNFLGVTGLSQKFDGPVNMDGLNVSRSPITNGLPKTFTMPGEITDVGDLTLPYIPLTSWTSLEYSGLDESLIKAPSDTDGFSVLGYKNVEGGKVTFVGMNYFYHLFLTHDKGELNMVTTLLQNSSSASQSPTSNLFTVTRQDITPDNMKFEIQNDKERLLLISMSYTPHWKAYLNGQPIQIRKIEDLMVVQAPAGNYTLEVKYESTSIMKSGWIVSILTILFLVYLIISNKLKKK